MRKNVLENVSKLANLWLKRTKNVVAIRSETTISALKALKSLLFAVPRGAVLTKRLFREF